MAGEGDRGSSVTSSPAGGDSLLPAKKMALVRVAVGVPMFFMMFCGLILAYRVTGKTLSGGVLWACAGALLAGFSIYALGPILSLLRRK